MAAGELSKMSHEHGFSEMLGWADWVIGWAACEQNRVELGLAKMAASIAFHQSIGGTVGTPWRRGVLAEGYAKNGRLHDAQDELRGAIDAAEQTGEHFFDAELYRIGGQITLQSYPPDQLAAESNFRKAIAVAQRQQARLWELRATVSLARLLRDTNPLDQARSLLAEIYNWFTEGFDTRDLQEAKQLLNELDQES